MDEIHETFESKMQKAVNSLQRELSTIRAGRATPGLLDKIEVDYYGTPTPLNQLAGITVPEPRLIVIQPWDKNVMPEVEKAILKSDLGLTPSNDGTVIRLSIPQLTEERRRELVKFVRKKAEEGRVSVRNIRRDANETLKSQEKSGEISEDQKYKSQERMQEITDRYIKEIDNVLQLKEKDIMEV